MNPNINDNPCICCGNYAVEGSQLCWKCQQIADNLKIVKDDLVEQFLRQKKVLDKKNKV